MKIYTHPIIKLPSGNVEVKFYDKNKTGEETLPDCIIDIGDVEEGFDYNFGEYNAPTCDFKIWNKENIIKNMFDTNELKVSVNVNGENYFYGFVNIPSVKPSDNFFFEYSFSSFGVFSGLSSYSIYDFYLAWNPLVDGPSGYNKFRVFTRLMAKYLGLKNFVANDIEYLCQRKYSWQNGSVWKEYYLNDLLFSKSHWYNVLFSNSYDTRLANAFELLNEFKNEFFFFPSVKFDGTDFKMKIMEKDIHLENLITPVIKKRSKETNYFMSRLIVDLMGRPEHMSPTDLNYDSLFNGNNFGDVVEYFMTHTNIARAVNATENDEAFSTNLLLYVKDDPNTSPGYASLLQRITNYNGSAYVNYTSFQGAIFNAIESIYNKNINWERFTIHGLTAVKSNEAKLEYLMPCYRFNFENNNYFIHSVTKSLKRNESEVVGLVV